MSNLLEEQRARPLKSVVICVPSHFVQYNYVWVAEYCLANEMTIVLHVITNLRTLGRLLYGTFFSRLQTDNGKVLLSR